MNNQLFINKINLIIFLFCCSLSLWSNYLNQYITPLVSLFVILILGTSHGALDNYKGSILLKHYRIKNIFIFYFIYLLISLIFFSFWIFIPSVLIIFLLVASYHFGKEDSEILKHDASISSRIIYFIKGSLIIFAPLYFQFEETVNLFELINLDAKYLYLLKNNNLIISIFYISIFSNLYFLRKFNFLNLKIICLDISSIILLFYFLSPLVAFTFYFCFIHSLRHIVSLASLLSPNDLNNGLNTFMKKAMPLTLLTALIFIGAVVFSSQYYSTNESIIKVIFIGLASLTFPHILLEYLLKKNEK